ncbi:MAG: PaaI family thioesterase [Sphingobacteriaceae bacterium]
MENSKLAWLKAHLGQSTKKSPSPFAHWLDGILEEAEFGQVTVRYAVRPDMTNPHNTLHGGVIAGMLDDVIGTAVASLGKELPFVSINLTVDFVQAAKVSDEVIAKAKVIRNGRTVVYVQAELLNKSAKLLAVSTSNLVVMPQKI